jgi:septal ring factor EnvC (AmiA/AmiB activator)
VYLLTLILKLNTIEHNLISLFYLLNLHLANTSLILANTTSKSREEEKNMSLAATQARLIMQTRYISDLEYGKNMISQEQQELAYKAQECSDDPQAVDYYHTQSKDLEAQMATIETQYKMGSTELESLKKMIDDGVKRSAYA